MTGRGAVIDLDGTVYRGEDALPGAAEAIARLREAGFRLLFFSNNPTQSRAAYADRLGEMGIEADEAEVLSAGTLTTEYLVRSHADGAVFVIGAPGLCEQFDAADLRRTDDPEAADVLVASWDREFDYDDMWDALRAIDDDTAFVGTDPDRVVPAGDGRMIPGSGAIVHAVEGVVDREADRIMGKPSPEAVAAAERELGVPPAECVLVGDRLDTDVAMGERAGMTSVLVLSGVTDRGEVRSAEVTPDHVLDSIADVPGALGLD